MVNENNTDLTKFLTTDEDGVFYTCHASILVRLNNKITFEEVLGTRRFRYIRNPNMYRVEINQIYTNYL